MKKLRYPQEHIERGSFVLHSGGRAAFRYDVNSLLANEAHRRDILERIPMSEHYVGIATGGALIAGWVAQERGQAFSMVKDGELKGRVPKEDYLLIDDVVTTESSLREAISAIGKKPREILVAVDRRKEQDRDLEIISLYEI